MRQKDFLSIDQLTAEELIGLVRLAGQLKDARAMADKPLSGRTVALLFQKPPNI